MLRNSKMLLGIPKTPWKIDTAPELALCLVTGALVLHLLFINKYYKNAPGCFAVNTDLCLNLGVPFFLLLLLNLFLDELK